MSPTLQALPLRPYQREALDALNFTEDVRRLAIVLPTGGGKTVCFAHDAMEYLDQHPDRRVLVLVHTDELVAQAFQKIKDVAPHLNVGIVKAARNETTADVIVASVQSLRDPARRKQIRLVGRVIVDECHHATAKTYMDILTDLGCFGGDCVAVGFTATLVRGDGKSLYPVWQDVAYSRDISWMVRRRYLVPPRGLAIRVPDLDLRKVKTTRADYREGELGDALAESLAPSLVAEAYLEHAKGRRAILFAPTVAAASVFADAMEEAGVPARVIHGGMALADRQDVLAQHRAGLFNVLCNCMILTEGYDDPAVSCVIVARPTKSRGLYVQMVGRGLRVDSALPYEGQDCLILDVVGASAENDLRSLIDLSERKIDPDKAREGRTLIELEDDLDAGPGVELDDTPLYYGPVEAKEFNPLGNPSSRAWIVTRDGTYFLVAGKEHYVFLLEHPSAGRWSVVQVGKTGRPHMTEHRGLPMDQAMVWAEDLALDLGARSLNTAGRAASWRKKVASESMASLARALGLKVEGTTDPASGLFTVTEKAGKLSDRIDKVMGSNRIDPLVRGVKGR